MSDNDAITLTVRGQIYGGWTAIGFSRSIDRMASHFTIEVSERWGGPGTPWQIRKFDPCALRIGGDLVCTGYVDEYAPAFDANEHRVRVSGRSRTCDLVDCTPDVPSGQFRGYTLAAIARTLAGLFGIAVVVTADAAQVFADATFQRSETAFTFLERLGRLAGVLLTDDEAGNLVLTTAGSARAAGRLVQGQNIVRASAALNGARQFSQYIVKGQRSLGSAGVSWAGAGTGGAAPTQAPSPVKTNLRAVATDPTVPRYRPKVKIAEAQLDDAGMQRRANWERNYAYGRSVTADISVAGWRQPSGALWEINQLIAVDCPFLEIAQDLLIVEVSFVIDAEQGRMTTLKLGVIDGYTPDPGEVKIHAKKGRHGNAGSDWNGVSG